MASVKKIPYGYNPNYETVIKIIGSKYVRCLEEKSDGNAKKGTKAEMQSMLRTLPSHNRKQTHEGKPPGRNKAPGQQINPGLEGEQQNKDEKEGHRPKQAETSPKRSEPPNAHCVTVPSGDKSLSYIHVFRNPSLGAQISRQQKQDIAQEQMETLEKSDPLMTSLRKELELNPLNLTTLEKLQDEMKALDPRASGLLPQAQLSHLLLKHEVPLQLPTVKALFRRFSKPNDREWVNYKNLLQLLTKVAASQIQEAPDFPEKSQNAKLHSKSAWTAEDAFESFKQIVKEHKGEMSLGKLSRSFLEEDKNCSGLLSVHETEMICQKHRLPLLPGMLEALVTNYEFGRRGRVRWRMFVEFLKKVQDRTDSALPICKRTKEKNEDDSQDKGQHKPPAFKRWEQVKSDTSDSSDAEERDAWIDRFRKLERALYLSDVKNTGKLEKEKAKRLIHNYNQIYDLCLSPLKIDNAFRPFHPGQDMSLEPLLNYLKEL
ncbi:uncharacterized protein C1orf87 homolog [Tiliqua scincoides]|uniref:uncharacterized protein C1orf87 homolog n=1 Tax=Tiliqua scincoides TaxID=71010 RepID=UPI003462FBA1